MPTYQDIEDALNSLETYVSAQIPIITHSLQRLTDDLRRFGPPELPSMPEILPSFPLFASVPPPPPPLPALPVVVSNSDRVVRWTGEHKYALIGLGVGVGVLGLGLAAGGYRFTQKKQRSVSAAAGKKVEGKEVIVVLGADTPLGPLVVADLRSKGYIVIASVSVAEAVAELEQIDRGYVRALVLDPYDPSSTTPFMRALQSTLSQKFPLAPGDPYRTSSPSDIPMLVSLISLLSLVTPPSATPGSSMTISSPPHALSTLSISKDYLPHLIATHLTPLTVIQSMLPLLRSTRKKGASPTSVVVALPGGPTAAGIVGQDSSPALSSAAMAKATEILRRELAVTPDLKGTRVVVIDVGELSVSPISQHPRRTRQPTDARHFSEAVLRVVGGSRRMNTTIEVPRPLSVEYVNLLFRSIRLGVRDWWRGDRFSVGSGAAVYAFASFLPTRLLDVLLLLPERLLAYRDNVRRKARALKREAHERRREQRSRTSQGSDAWSSSDINSRGKEIVIIHKPATPAPPMSPERRVSAVSSNVPSPLSSPELSQVPSMASSEDGGAHQERIAESWVMDVDPSAEEA